MFYSTDTRGQCYKKLIRNLQISVKSQSVGPRKAFLDYSNKHSSLVWKLVNYGRKKFYNIGPRGPTRLKHLSGAPL
jgi:hypothetical protein